jgi:dihydrodipicolinate synthase/N-acetylneuraminate lyase
MLDPNNIKDWLRGPLIPMATPFTEDFDLDLEAFSYNVNFTIEHGVKTGNGALLVGGAAGEHPLLNIEERKTIMTSAVEAANNRVPVLTSVQHTDPRIVIELAKHASKVGLQAVQVSPLYYYPATDQDVLRLFKQLSDQIDISIMVYNTWWLGFHMNSDLLNQLAQIEIVRALKWAAPDQESFRGIIASFHKELVIYDNTDQVSLSHSLGAQGFVGHLGTCWPEYPLRTWELLEKEDYSSVKDHLDSFKVGWRRWIEKVGVLTAGEGPLVKTPMEIAGLKVGPPRPPGIRPPNHLIQELEQIMETAGVPKFK